MNGNVLQGTVNSLAGNYSLTQTAIGVFNIQVLDVLINLVLNKGVIPAANTYLAKGFPIPTVKGKDTGVVTC